MPKLNLSRAVSAAAKASAAVTLAVRLFASSPYMNEARAIDLAPAGTNAALVFSDTIMTKDAGAQLCAHNYNKDPVNVIFVFGVDSPVPSSLSSTIPGNDHQCADFVDEIDGLVVRGAIILESPADCSRATEYPGKCRVVGSLDFYPRNSFAASPPPIRHFEPVLPGSPRINSIQMPQ